MGSTVRGSRATPDDRLIVLVVLTVAIAVGLGAAADRAAAATGDPAVVFVVDTSTSMAGAPIAEAKRALTGAASAVPPGVNVGLRSFGGPCDDGGIARLPLGPFNPMTFGAAVEGLSIGASGTPTPAALRAAAATLPPSGPRTVVFVSDGGSSCGSPCIVARELASRLGAGFQVDTVGFRAPESAEYELDCIARVTGGSYVSVTNSAGLQKTLAESTAARVTALRISPATFKAASKGGSISKVVKPKAGARVTYSLSENVKVRFTVERAASGRFATGRCRAPSAKNRGARRCTRYVRLAGSFSQEARKGTNRFRFSGRLRARKLVPGRYRLVATATDAGGNTAKPAAAKFVVKRR